MELKAFQKDEVDLVIKEYIQKIKLNPNNSWAYSNLANYLLELNLLKEAKVLYYKALKLNPRFPEIYAKLGKLYQKIKDLDKSNICYATSIKLNPINYWAYENLCQNLIAQNKPERAIDYYQKFLIHQPENLKIYRKLGQLYVESKQLERAINCYEKAISIKHNKLDYCSLAKVLIQGDRLKEASIYYQKYLQLNSNYDGVYQEIGDTFRQQGKFDEAISYYQKAKHFRTVSNNTELTLFPEYTYLINHQYRFIYCPIYKVACSSFKKLILKLNEPEKFQEIMSGLSGFQFHIYIDRAYSLFRYTAEEASQIWQDEQYFKFVFVRNPWNRLVSAYLNKFMQTSPKPFTLEVIQSVYERQNLTPDYERSITFKQFINYLVVTEDELLNGHWKPQYLFLGNNKFDFIGKFETLTQDFQYIKQKLNLELDLEWANKTEKTENINVLENYADYYPDSLRQLKQMPNYKSFYTPDLVELVRERYRNDVEMFDYEF
jgi:tetratricopeptide (TPR) repeat protein